jgi:selenocysteine lyase/cysteine desulfurase
MPRRSSTRRGYVAWFQNHVLPQWGDKRVTELQARPVELWLQSLNLSPKSRPSELGIQSKTPPDSVGPLVVLRAKNADALVQKLATKGIVVSSRHDGLRISFHVYNTLEDVNAVLQVLEENLGLLAATKSTSDVMSQP